MVPSKHGAVEQLTKLKHRLTCWTDPWFCNHRVGTYDSVNGSSVVIPIVVIVVVIVVVVIAYNFPCSPTRVSATIETATANLVELLN